MLKKSVLCLAIAGMSSAFAADYVLDPDHTNARFHIDHNGVSTNHAGFYNLEGEVTFDAAAKTGFVDVTVPISSLLSGSEGFTGHLKSPDLFNIGNYPSMRFVSTQWNFDGDKVKSIEGNLSLLNETHPITLTATKFNCIMHPRFKKEVCGGDFTATIDRTQWGMNFGVARGGAKEVTILLQVEALKK